MHNQRKAIQLRENKDVYDTMLNENGLQNVKYPMPTTLYQTEVGDNKDTGVRVTK